MFLYAKKAVTRNLINTPGCLPKLIHKQLPLVSFIFLNLRVSKLTAVKFRRRGTKTGFCSDAASGYGKRRVALLE